MTIDMTKIDPVVEDEISRFAAAIEEYLAGDLDEDVFRVTRLTQGIYGQRQGGTNQMVRVRIPYGAVTPEQLEAFAVISEEYSRGWGHLTTRQNIQFHFVELRRVPDVLRVLAEVGLTSREACGDTVRNVQGCHLAGACPFEVLDISAWAQATNDYLLRNPLGQRLPRKFKINFSGCATDCGQAMFNDVGVIAVSRTRPDGTTEPGFRVFLAGGLGANPFPAQALEEFTSRDDLLATVEAILRTFDHYGNRDNKLRARMKWLVDTMGIDELRERILKERKFLRASATWPGGVPALVEASGDAPAGGGGAVAADGGVQVTLNGLDPFRRWDMANVVRGRTNGTVSAYAHAPLGDLTTEQLRGLAALQRELAADVRITNRQNLVFRGLAEGDLPLVHERLEALGLGAPGAELSRDVVSCPGADTCNLAVTQSRGLGDDIARALDEAGLAEVGGVRVNISGCTNSCGQHHISDIGFFGLERRAHGRSAPGYQMLLGGHVGEMEIAFGEKATKVPAKNASEAVVRVVRRFADERTAGETFGAWLTRSGGAGQVGAALAELDVFPSPEEDPDFYTDFGETGPYVKDVGAGECAT
jgi:sulfite reductase beta subunit-like hemoprotein